MAVARFRLGEPEEGLNTETVEAEKWDESEAGARLEISGTRPRDTPGQFALGTRRGSA